jgi:hypothetical protein
MRTQIVRGSVAVSLALLALIGAALAADDKYTLRVPDGVPFSDFKGYEDWQVVAVRQDRHSGVVLQPAG